MVAYARQEDSVNPVPVLIAHLQHKQGPIEQHCFGVVCPKCIRHLNHHEHARSSVPDRYGRRIRRYYGWCVECETGFEVVQFEQAGLWKINKYRLYPAIKFAQQEPNPLLGSKSIAEEWITVNELPEPAPVIIGPGGEYDKSFELETIDLMETVLAALKATAKTVESLLKLVIGK